MICIMIVKLIYDFWTVYMFLSTTCIIRVWIWILRQQQYYKTTSFCSRSSSFCFVYSIFASFTALLINLIICSLHFRTKCLFFLRNFLFLANRIWVNSHHIKDIAWAQDKLEKEISNCLKHKSNTKDLKAT